VRLDGSAPRAPARNWWRIPVLLISFAFAILITWYQFQGGGEHSVLLTFALLALLYGLINTGVIQLPPGTNLPFLTVWPRLSDWVKAVVSGALIFLWTPIAVKLVPNASTGVAIVLLIPNAIFALAALVFVSNGLSRNSGAP
jgi:hypothetical protein